MIPKFLTAALVVAAFGCARSAPAPKVVTAAPAKPARTQQALVAKQRELRPVGVAKELRPLDQQQGVALHGPEKTYLEQVDNSGWSGRSPSPAPEGIGGGPPEYEDDTDEEQQSSEK